jgi:uncharacterized protein (DUF433 family)
MVVRTGSEAEKTRRVPGVVFVDGPAGRRPHVEGSGLDVFEVIKTYHKVRGDEARLAAAYDWLAPHQLEAALRFYRLFPAEIDAWLAVEAAVTPERVRAAVATRHASAARRKSK